MGIPASISTGICWDGFGVFPIITNVVTSHPERLTWRACSSNEDGFLTAKAWIWNNSTRQLQFVLAWLFKVILSYVFTEKIYQWFVLKCILGEFHTLYNDIGLFLPPISHPLPALPRYSLTWLMACSHFISCSSSSSSSTISSFFIKPSEILARMGKDLLWGATGSCCFGGWPLVSFTGFSDCPHIHAHMGITNWT